ncbi:MBL fold metallo-hydrolase [Aneurinibacillus sp. Ricciae_BoGa-3]|uniref:MBL fold metallo-hydrolase n=1 Tax=Aneurinibacillus sp. Ricciae_BoGa-3 TaxID=3022697 RepID=UPI0023403FC1|nr:MBL fold metallo-hydrolase [Aneurinibacillus sp. Ricciae_BoGa-3]WCK55601.1 MBL fold metallo-hydrolase [Aneurinibacillus sp. Ricciae_BoGa-3]
MLDKQAEQYGLYQVTLPLPFRLNHIHAYLARQGNQWKIVDAGLNGQRTRESWERAFMDFDIKPDDIHHVLLTHYHPDHLGFAGSLQEWTGASVGLSRRGQELAAEIWTEERLEKNLAFYQSAGMPADLLQRLQDDDRAFRPKVHPLPARFQEIQEGERYQIGELDYQAIHTPGHAEGHMCFYNATEKVLIGGDHLLRRITPNVSYHGYGDPNPLASYLSSLTKIGSMPINLVLPGHGPIFSDAGARVEELLLHHEERLHFILSRLKGKMTAWEVSNVLFERILSVHEQRFAIGETLSHLSYLVADGRIEQESDESGCVTKYQVV